MIIVLYANLHVSMDDPEAIFLLLQFNHCYSFLDTQNSAAKEPKPRSDNVSNNNKDQALHRA